MKILIFIISFILMASFFSSCVTTKGSAQPFTFKTQAHKALYDLMDARCKALSATNMKLLKPLYTENSTEPAWLAKHVFPTLREWPAKYKISRVEIITIVGQDAAASYRIYTNNNYKSSLKTVDVLYEIENGAWKIDSVTIR